MVKDARIEDIVVPSANKCVSCTHSDYGIMPTNVSFEPEELDRYLERLVHLSGKSVSLFRPILSIRLPTETASQHHIRGRFPSMDLAS